MLKLLSPLHREDTSGLRLHLLLKAQPAVVTSIIWAPGPSPAFLFLSVNPDKAQDFIRVGLNASALRCGWHHQMEVNWNRYSLLTQPGTSFGTQNFLYIWKGQGH